MLWYVLRHKVYATLPVPSTGFNTIFLSLIHESTNFGIETLCNRDFFFASIVKYFVAYDMRSYGCVLPLV